jgi:hypothetical protein
VTVPNADFEGRRSIPLDSHKTKEQHPINLSHANFPKSSSSASTRAKPATMSTPFEMEQKLQYRLEQSRAHKNIQLVSLLVRMSRLRLSSQKLTFAFHLYGSLIVNLIRRRSIDCKQNFRSCIVNQSSAPVIHWRNWTLKSSTFLSSGELLSVCRVSLPCLCLFFEFMAGFHAPCFAPPHRFVLQLCLFYL